MSRCRIRHQPKASSFCKRRRDIHDTLIFMYIYKPRSLWMFIELLLLRFFFTMKIKAERYIVDLYSHNYASHAKNSSFPVNLYTRRVCLEFIVGMETSVLFWFDVFSKKHASNSMKYEQPFSLFASAFYFLYAVAILSSRWLLGQMLRRGQLNLKWTT